MALKLNTAPALEPVTLSEAKLHLRLDSGTLSDNMDISQSIVPGAHVVAAAYSLVGTAVDVLGYSPLVVLDSGTNGAGGTVAVKLQHSDDNVTFADVTSGAFTQVTTSNDNAVQEKTYTGGKQYLRVVATVANATCDFGVSIVEDDPQSTEDDLVTRLIETARQMCEDFQRRAYINQVWELWRDAWPDKDFIEIPLPPLQETAVTAGSFVTGTVYRILTVGTTDFTAIGASANTVGVVFTATGAGSGTGTATASCVITYYDTDDTAAFMDAGEYLVDTRSEPGRICLNYGESWPSTTLRPHNGIRVTFIAGYGAAASAVPSKVKQAMLLIIGHLYEHREEVITTGANAVEIPMGAQALLYQNRVFGF